MRRQTKFMLFFLMLIAVSLTGCAEDNAMHLTGENYLHKESAEQRKAIVKDSKEGLANLGKYTKKYNMDFTMKSSLDAFENATNNLGSGEGGGESVFQQEGYLYFPIKQGTFTSDFSGRVLDKGYEFHSGIDLGVPVGTPLNASLTGKVVTAGLGAPNSCASTGGCNVTIEGKLGSKTIQVTYMHLQKPTGLKVGDTVNVGQQIGYTGNTGRSTGAHLHIEVAILDTYIAASNSRLIVTTMYNKDTIMAMKGAWWWKLPHLWSRIDPKPFFKEMEGKSPTRQNIQRIES